MNEHKFFLFDYADVISLPQDMSCFQEMANLLNMDRKAFHEAYWKFRKPYDLGQKGEDYWPLVANRHLEKSLVTKLIDWDCEGWGRLNPLTLAFIGELRKAQRPLGLLSNLPIELVHYLRRTYDFLGNFDHVFFSAELHLVKPDVEIYQYVLSRIGVRPEDVIFFDDKEENLQAAKSQGMNTYLVTKESIEDFSEHFLRQGP